MSDEPRGLDAALALRWKLASSALLDPFSLVGAVAAAWACQRAGIAWVDGDPLRAALIGPLMLGGLTLLASALGAALLYERRENDLLRSLPLGPSGFLHLCQRELHWWTVVPRLLGAAAVWGGADATAAAAVFVGGWGATRGGLSLSLLLRAAGRRRAVRGLALLGVGLAAALHAGAWPDLVLPAWGAAAVAAAPLLATAGLPARLWPTLGARRLSEAVNRPRRAGFAWAGLLDRVLPLPGPVRARVLRDLLLLVRGRDVRAAVLLALSPLACLYLVDELGRSGNVQALTWRVLSAAALGGAAVAYAGGPAVHLLRARGLAWERVATSPGRRHLAGAMLWSLTFALAHGALVLATVALAHGGVRAGLVPSLILPVLGLELAMAHFVVAFVAGATDGRRIAGEGTIALMLPVVALAVALVGLLAAWAIPLYFVVTANMVGQGVRRIDTMEVSW